MKVRSAQSNYERLDVRDALRKLFRKQNFSYSIAPDVQGEVMYNPDLPFPEALRVIVRQVGATYRLEAGVYEVIKIEG